MVNILTKKQAGTGFSILDAVGIALSKTVLVDGIATPLLSNFTRGNNFLNAIGKVGGAIATNTMAKGQVGSIIATSMVVSAGDDLISPFLNGRSNNANLTTQQGGGDTFGQSNVQLPSLSVL